MSPQVEHTDVGAYALGLLEDGDRRAFEAHLDGCTPCRAELAEMAGMAAALSDVGPFLETASGPGDGGVPGDAVPRPRAAEDEPVHRPAHGPGSATAGQDETEAERAAAPVIDLLRRRRSAERRFRRGTYLIGAAAAAVLLATGVAVGTRVGGAPAPVADPHSGHGLHAPTPGPAQALVLWGERREASDPRTGASGVTGLEGKGWGTHVGLELRGVKGPLSCHLEAVSRTGERTIVTGWRVPAKGYGVPGSPDPLMVHGGTGIARGDLDRLEVRIDGGGTLLTIRV
ncbi:anti-sigma factor family protein [Actinomadura roseirufa]|uniref:anti-sigma factor family protein n=1 Tax=Actinomadura roseirufa TaxID=2094049 RepID=UPI001041A010|nr:zf-HC2 domain-containing protein [Actinomadura roseirufa]